MWAIAESTLNPAQRNVAIALARHASELDTIAIKGVDYAVVFPGLERLCWATQQSLPTVKKSLRQLGAIGFAREYVADDKMRSGRSFKKCFLLNAATLTTLPTWAPGAMFEREGYSPRRGERKRGKVVSPSCGGFPQREGERPTLSEGESLSSERGNDRSREGENFVAERGKPGSVEEDLDRRTPDDRREKVEEGDFEEEHRRCAPGFTLEGPQTLTSHPDGHRPTRAPNVLPTIDVAVLKQSAVRPLKPKAPPIGASKRRSA